MNARAIQLAPRGERTKGRVQPLNLLVPQTVKVSSGVKEYGRGNTLPNLLLDIVADSGTATACVEKRAEYIKADGFADKTFANFQVNESQTADDILEEIASYMGIFPGCFSLLVHHSLDDNTARIRVLPFEHIRKTVNGDFIYNPTYSARNGQYSRNKDILYPAYVPGLDQRARQRRIKDLLNTQDEQTGEYVYRDLETDEFVGELWYIFSPKARQPDYPVPGWVAGDWDIKTDAELSKYEFEQLDNGFMGTTIIQTRTLSATPDETGKSELDEFDAQINGLRGTGNRGGILHLQAKTREEFAEVTVLNPTQSAADLETKQDYIGRKVCRHFRVPPPLVGFSRPGQLGDVQELVNSVTLLNHSVNPDQRVIQRVFETLYPGGDRSISTFNPISQIPAEVMQVLTNDEKRALAGYPPLAQPQPNALPDGPTTEG